MRDTREHRFRDSLDGLISLVTMGLGSAVIAAIITGAAVLALSG